MSTIAADKMVERFQDAIDPIERIGVSEFARCKTWRDRLPDIGCFQITDRNGVVGYVLAPEYAEAINEKMIELEEQAERAQIEAMFEARAGYTNVLEGKELKTAALDYFDKHADELLEVVNGG